jgi:hypothetical protein
MVYRQAEPDQTLLAAKFAGFDLDQYGAAVR